jgi:RHS repeat-associated protein
MKLSPYPHPLKESKKTRVDFDFGYDPLQRLTAVTQNGTGIANKRVNFGYDALGQLKLLSRFASIDNTAPLVNTSFNYGSTGLTTQVQHRLGATLLSDNAWTHDAAERVMRYASPDGSSDYSYDNTDQLTVADHSYQTDEAYSYDANGNRTNTGYVTSTYNRLTADGTFTYTYDNEGNRTQRSRTGEIVTYTWDHRNRLTRVEFRATAGGAMTRSAVYTYDAFDRRISKTIDPDGAGPNPATIQRFVYDRDHIWLSFDSNNNVTHRYLYGPAIDMVLVDEISATNVLWPLTDNQGTIRDITNNAGAVQNHITYNSFGRIISQTNPNVYTRFNYTGRELDGETGMYYYRSRYYDCVVGRFISEDAIGFQGGDANLYRYVGNSAVNAIDPFGYLNINGKSTFCPNTEKSKPRYRPKPSCPPLAPPGVDIDANIREALRKQIFALNAPGPQWFYNAVKNFGRWDYKRRGRQYEDFGNFNYGATGAATGFTEKTLLSEAGRVQVQDEHSRSEWGKPGTPLSGEGGIPPYGDDPKDQYWIKRGINYYLNKFRNGGNKNLCEPPIY